MTEWILVAVGGAIGSVARHGVTKIAVSAMGSSLLGTFLANVSGSFILGIFLGLSIQRPDMPPEARWFVAVGLMGGYTTFSTLVAATVQLSQDGDLFKAAASLAGSVTAGLVAAFLGILIGRSW